MVSRNNRQEFPTGLYWKEKKAEIDRVILPFQTIETVNESRATREKDKSMPLLKSGKKQRDATWYNRLIWGDNKYAMASLLDEFTGKFDFIYIDPPFATGADFSVKFQIGDIEWTKEPSVIEDKAYRDTWGKGLDSYLQMMYERLTLMRDLMADHATICVHLDWRVGHYVKILLDDIFGRGGEKTEPGFRNEIIWCYTGPSGIQTDFPRKHDIILRYSKSTDWTFNALRIPYKSGVHDTKGTALGYRGKAINLNQVEKKGKIIEDWWTDIWATERYRSELLAYQTQKPEALLKRLINVCTNENDLIGDFFCGSGTTGAVAEKLGRRWIMADLSRFAIHTTRKRLLSIDGCNPFIVQNLGKYERQYWQGITFKKKSEQRMPIYEYIQFILQLYHAESIGGMLHIHGKKGRRLVHVGAVDSPVTLTEIKETLGEVRKSKQDAVDILGWEWEMGLHDVVENVAKESGVKLRLFNIPRDVMDARAVEKGDITFYELAYLEIDIYKNRYGEFVVELKDFAIPNLDLIPEDVRDKIKKWSDCIDYWAVDWDWNEDTFHNMWQSYRIRKERKLELKSDGHKYTSKGTHIIMVKVIDIFGNDTTKIHELKS